MAFFDSLKQHLVRTWTVDAFQGWGSQVCIIWDASPYGFGAVLVIDDVITEYFHDVPRAVEVELLGLHVGDSESQQALECLGGLVALRTWSPYWMTKRVILSLRSDNVGALVLLGRLKTSSSRNSIMAREFALDLGNACFAPKVTEHIPGFTNQCCDALSRLDDPNMKYATPSLLRRITGARMLASLGLDPITIGLRSRWSSNAILTYLGEAPLVSVSRRLHILTGVDPALQALSKRVASLEEAFASSDESSADEGSHSS